MLSDKPIYNLKLVLNETGIKADVLRAWERRYGLPMPQRSPGGHRLYSQKDIATIKWLLNRQQEGLSISRAVKLWNEKLANLQDPLAEDSTAPTTSLTPYTADSTLESLRKSWLKECLVFNEPAAEQILNQAFSLYPVEMAVSQIIQQGMHELGDSWYSGDISVQQEHFASAISLRKIESLISATPLPHREETIVLACPPDEWHTFPLIFLNLLLRRKGYPVIFFGANVPIINLRETAENINPALIILASQQLASASNLQKAAFELKKGNFQVAYGGRIFNTIPELRERIPGHFLGATLEESLITIDRLVRAELPAQDVQPAKPRYQHLAKEFLEKRILIEAETREELLNYGMAQDHVRIANLHLGNGLASALELGNIDFLTKDLDWLKGSLSRHNIPSDHLHHYLLVYGKSMLNVLNGYSSLISHWVDSITIDS